MTNYIVYPILTTISSSSAKTKIIQNLSNWEDTLQFFSEKLLLLTFFYFYQLTYKCVENEKQINCS